MAQILVRQIVVPKSSFDAPEPWELMCANEVFVHRVMRDGLYEHSELLPDCVMLYHVLEYDRQVGNGGHEQYLSNRGWKSEVNEIVQSGLIAIGATQIAELFRVIRTYVNAIPEDREKMRLRGGFNDIGGGSGKVDRGVQLYDKEYYRLGREKQLTSYGSEFLRHHPALMVVPDSEWSVLVKSISDSNPYLGARRAALDYAMTASKEIFQRKVSACAKLSAIIGRALEANTWTNIEAPIDGIIQKVALHWTDKLTAEQGKVIYYEQGGRACVASFPDGKLLASVALNT